MRVRAALALALALSLAGCGVKSDLQLPDGSTTPKSEKDPSKPPAPNTSR
ncbi:MAG TPA: lipoprotein [Rhizomicrobium sp.]|jgi:predicted small lipoprotein YifL|nr:lipoprotein [Rhizomicrobium sp.]